ncbi:RES family NAD+ phosphorylase [Phenylobacterium sp. LjRoot219]|uniref:RES family NAD+ phosphorylase n=1 Tax=Phenylobacterium sp. LjRoot219 TaxID=3342283 RepID=UPI003ECEEDC8
MKVYRLARAPFAALDGEGARLYGGRWNTAGRALVYAAASPSLAVLEILVHLDLPPELVPDDYRLLTIEVPDELPLARLQTIPAEPTACRDAGDAFLRDGQRVALSVPSVVVPQERNLLINPVHPLAGRIRTTGNEPFAIDARLF